MPLLYHYLAFLNANKTPNNNNKTPNNNNKTPNNNNNSTNMLPPLRSSLRSASLEPPGPPSTPLRQYLFYLFFHVFFLSFYMGLISPASLPPSPCPSLFSCFLFRFTLSNFKDKIIDITL